MGAHGWRDRWRRPDAAPHHLQSRRRLREAWSAGPRVSAGSALDDVSGAGGQRGPQGRPRGRQRGTDCSGAAGQLAIRARDRHRGDRAHVGPQ